MYRIRARPLALALVVLLLTACGCTATRERYCAWTYQVEKETKLGKGLKTAGKAIGDAALVTGGAAALVALEAATAYAWDQADDDQTADHNHHHGHGPPKPRPHPGKADDGDGD